MSADTRFILLHHHTFKNAGTSLDTALRQHFGQKFSEFHPEAFDDGRVSAMALYDYLDSHPHIQVVSSHHFHGRDFGEGVDSERGQQYHFLDFILLRHPVSRLVSTYLHYRRIPQNEHPLSVAAHHLTLSNFLKRVLQFHSNFAVNPQVTVLGGDKFPPTEENYERALARVETVAICGTVEQYIKSIVYAEYVLQPIFKGFLFQYRKENVSYHEILPGYDGSIKSINNIIGDSLFFELCRANALDILLWRTVTNELNRKASLIADFAIRQNKMLERYDIFDAARRRVNPLRKLKSVIRRVSAMII